MWDEDGEVRGFRGRREWSRVISFYLDGERVIFCSVFFEICVLGLSGYWVLVYFCGFFDIY